MSFHIEPSFAPFHATSSVNITQLPYKYLPQLQETPASSRGHVDSWYQPGAQDNYALLNAYGIDSNQTYRKYMTHHSMDVRKYNDKTFVSTIK